MTKILKNWIFGANSLEYSNTFSWIDKHKHKSQKSWKNFHDDLIDTTV